MSHVNVARALFTDEGKPDTEVRVLLEPEGDISFSILFGSGDKLLASALPGDRVLQLAESLQFVADTVSIKIPGRLSPFVRGWINTASDIALKTSGDLDAQYEELTDEEATAAISDLITRHMAYAHARGLPIAKTIEATSRA